MLSKCLCFDLKYGYLAYASINVIVRTALMLFLYSLLQSYLYHSDVMVPGIFCPALLIGWYLITIVFSFLVIAGTIQGRSILIYPYIVILITESIVFGILLIVLSALITPFLIIGIWFLTGLYVYDILCLISLYKTIKNKKLPVQQLQPNQEELLCAV